MSTLPTNKHWREVQRDHHGLDFVSVAASSSMLPPIPSCLCDRIVSGEFIDLNSLLTRAMFSTCDGPMQFQSSLPLFTFQMSAQNSGIQVSQAPITTRKINSFALWMEAQNVYASILPSAYLAHAQELLGYQHLVISANLQYPFSSWMSYNVKFCMLVSTCPLLCWDTLIQIYDLNV